MPPLSIEVKACSNPGQSLVYVGDPTKDGHSVMVPTVIVPHLLAHDALVEVAREYLITCGERIRAMDEEHAEGGCDGDEDAPCDHLEVRRHYELVIEDIEAALKLAAVEERA